MYFDDNHLYLVYSQDRNYVYLFLRYPFIQLVKIANWFSFLNMSFSGGLKIFHGTILVSSLR